MDRLDIDALLVGSVYGELSSTDETLLRAHLESHPADRTLLDRLTHARAVVQESRALAVQVEPPAQLTALLLQEAARRVPRKVTENESRGWFAWLRRSIFMHPAMAVAAMLVVIVSVAGTLYMRESVYVMSKDEPAPELASSEPRDEAAGANRYSAAAGSAPAATAASEPDGARKRAGDQTYRVDLAPEGEGRNQRAVTTAAPPKRVPQSGEAVANQPAAAEGQRPRPNTILEVTTADREPKPKELDYTDARAVPAAPAPAPTPSPPPATQATRAPDANDNRAPAQKPSRTSADPPPADAITRRDVDDAEKKNRSAPGGAAKADAPSAGVVGGGKGAPEPESVVVAQEADDAWSRDQHARLVAQVRARNCNDAAGTAAELEGRAPAYYKQNVATDRSVKDCLAYINSARDRALERSKAAKRSNDNAKDTAPAKAAPAKAAPSQQRSAPAPSTPRK